MITITRYITEESRMLVVASHPQSPDGKATAVVVALEWVALCANGSPLTAKRNVGGLLEIHITVALATIHVGCQLS